MILPGGILTREDIKRDIASHGWFGRVSALPPEKVARRALAAVSRNCRRVVIGFWNKVLYCGMHLVPLSVKLRVIAKIWSKSEKDAF